MSLSPMDASARVCAGVDWAKDDHAVCIVDADGEVLDRFMVAHTATGLKRLITQLLQAGVVEVGIERGDGPVVEALLAAELVVLVIAPNQLKNLRSRYGSAGNKDDRYDAAAHATVTLAFLAVLRALNGQIEVLAESIADQLKVHPDAALVKSLPRAGTLRAARLLAEIGDARGRFPTADSLACLAGVAPSTRQSGKVKAVTCRWAADKELRGALCDFAADSRHANPWAADLYNQARARGHDHPHAVRILGRAWANIIWRCWQNSAAYDPDQHRALKRVLNERAAEAA